MTRSPWLTVECPTCGARAGWRCFRVVHSPRIEGGTLVPVPTHRPRLTAGSRAEPSARTGVVRPATLSHDGHTHARDPEREAVEAGAPTLQEIHMRGDRLDAWRVASVCVLLTRVRASSARPVARVLFERWPTPGALALAPERQLRALLLPLGLVSWRAQHLRSLATAELHDLPVEAECGPYGREAIRLLVLRDLTVDPVDRILLAAKNHRLAREGQDCTLGADKASQV